MTKFSYEQLFRVLAHPGRLKILKMLDKSGPHNVTKIVRYSGIEQSAVSHYLKSLLVN